MKYKDEAIISDRLILIDLFLIIWNGAGHNKNHSMRPLIKEKEAINEKKAAQEYLIQIGRFAFRFK